MAHEYRYAFPHYPDPSGADRAPGPHAEPGLSRETPPPRSEVAITFRSGSGPVGETGSFRYFPGGFREVVARRRVRYLRAPWAAALNWNRSCRGSPWPGHPAPPPTLVSRTAAALALTRIVAEESEVPTKTPTG